MAYESVKIREIVERAVSHNWSIPEFQRGFVWKTTQVRDLAESLWLDFPIGRLLLWDATGRQQERIDRDGATPSQWLGGCQPRATSMWLLFWGEADLVCSTAERDKIV